MDAPENSGSRIGRTIWTVWGYLTGAVARYLRPEVTDKGNQNVNSRSDEAAVNKTDKEGKAESSESQHDKNTAEIKVSSTDIKAEVQWENTDVVKDDSKDELNVDVTKKQTYRFAMWSTGTERISGDAHAEKETAKSENKESDATHGLEEIGQTEQEEAENQCDWNNRVEKGVRIEELDDGDMLVQSELQEQDVDVEKLDHEETEVIGGLKHADTKEVDCVHQDNEETIENDEEKVQDLPPLLEYRKEEAEPETLNLLDIYSHEIHKLSKNEIDLMGSGTDGATEQDKDSEASLKIKQIGQTEQEDAKNQECNWNNQVKKCVVKEEFDKADTLVQSELQEQDVDVEKLDQDENEVIGGLKHADTKEVECFHQNNEETIENDEEKAQDLPPLLEYRKEEADGLSKPETLNLLDIYSDESYKLSENEVNLMGPETEGATKQDKDSEVPLKIKQIGQTEQEDAKKQECDWNNQVKQCVMKEEFDKTDTLVQSELQEQDVDVEKLDHGETEVIGGLKHADTNEVEFADEEMIEKDKEKVQDLPPLLKYRTDGLSMPEKLNLLDKYSDGIDEFSKKEVDQVGLDGAAEQDEDSKTSQKIKQTEQEDGNDEECVMKKEDPGYTMITVQSELTKQTEKRDHKGTEGIAGFKEAGEHVMDEKGTKICDQNDRGENEDEETAIKSQSEVEDVLPQLGYSTDTLPYAEKLNLMETYCSEIAENVAEGMSEMDENMTDGEQNTTSSELHESTETLHRVSNEMPKKHEPNNEMEPKMTTVMGECFETVNTSEDTMLSYSKQETPEITTETGTGSPVVAVKTEGMFSDVIVCEFPGELRKEPEISSTPVHLEEIETYPNDLQSVSERHLERDAEFACNVEHSETLKPPEEADEIEKDIKTVIESLGATESQEIDKTKLEFTEDVALSTKLMSEHEKAESFETDSQISITLESRELLEFTREECKSSKDTTMDTLSESLGRSDGSAEVEQVADVDSELTPAESLGKTLELSGEPERYIEEQEILETDLVKTALDYVEEITNQVLKEMIETEMLKKSERLVESSTEELGDAEYQATESSVSAEALVLEEERMFLDETMDGKVEMEVETTSSEDVKQNERHTSSPKLETAEADRHLEQRTLDGAELSAGTDGLGINPDDTGIEEHKDDDGHVENEEASSEIESKDSESAQNLETNWQIEQKDNEKWAMPIKKEDPENADMVQSEICGEDIEVENQIKMVDLEETEGTGGFRQSDERFTDEMEKNIDQNDQEKAEDDENQHPELQAPADSFVIEEEMMLLGEAVDGEVEIEVETTSSEDVKQNQQRTSSPKLKTTEADRHDEQQTHHCAELSAGTDDQVSNPDDTDKIVHEDDEKHVENKETSSEIEHANIECKDNEKNWQIDQNDGNNEHCAMLLKKEDPEKADMVQSELCGEDKEQEKPINMVDLEETEGTGGLTDEMEKNIDQNDEKKAEDDENQQPEVEAPADAFVLDEEMMLLGKTMESKVDTEVETTSREDVKQNQQHTSSPKLETAEADRHDGQQTHHCVEFSTGTDDTGSNPEDTDIEEHKDDDVENKKASSEIVYANIECKDSESAQELEKNWHIEQKDDDVKHAMSIKKEDSENADMVQSEICGEDVEQDKQISVVDLQESEGTVIEDERKVLGETMDGKVEMEVETTSSEDAKQNQQRTSSPKLDTTEADRHHKEQTHHCAELSAGTNDPGSNPDDTHIEGHKDDDGHVENKEASSEIEPKDSESPQNLEKEWAMLIKKEDPESADMVQSEICGEDIEEENQIKMVDLEETEGLRHSDEHFTDEKEKNVDQNDQAEDDENQQLELQAPADALQEEIMLLVETMDGKVEMEVETTRIEDVELICEADGRHEKIQKVIVEETLMKSHKDVMEVSKPGIKRRFGQVNKDPPEVKMQGTGFNLQDSSLDFTIQKSRIAVKNPLVRPPKDPRKLISKASVEPLLPQPSACSPRVNVSPLNKGMIGFKLPGLGAGMPVLRKTEFGKKAREAGEAEQTLQPQQKSVAEPEDCVKPEQTPAKPKWTPPRHPGMGGPMMMAELKNKLKKPSNE